MPYFNRILITIEEGIGNAIQALPTIYALSHYHPGAEIDVACSTRALPVIELQPIVNKFYVIRPGMRLRPGYDAGFLLQWSTGSSLQWMRQVCKAVYFNAAPDWSKESESQCNLDLLSNIGIVETADRWHPYLELEPDAVLFADRYDAGPYVALHFGCMDRPQWKTRQWPIEHWLALIGYLNLDGVTCVFIVGGDDRQQGGEIIRQAPPINDVLSGAPLSTVAAMIRQCGFLISLDSGIMHVGTTQRIKQISLWGPTSEIKSRPLSDRCFVMRNHALDCRRCYTADRKRWLSCTDNVCMKSITPQAVFEKYKEMTADDNRS